MGLLGLSKYAKSNINRLKMELPHINVVIIEPLMLQRSMKSSMYAIF